MWEVLFKEQTIKNSRSVGFLYHYKLDKSSGQTSWVFERLKGAWSLTTPMAKQFFFFFWDVGEHFSQECLFTGLFTLWLVAANFGDTSWPCRGTGDAPQTVWLVRPSVLMLAHHEKASWGRSNQVRGMIRWWWILQRVRMVLDGK